MKPKLDGRKMINLRAKINRKHREINESLYWFIEKKFLKRRTVAERIKKKEIELAVSRMKERISVQLLHTITGQ